MQKLTESMIIQRVRSSSADFEKISQLNITGRGLTDISLLKKLTKLQVLSLSVNNISSLADLESCKHLKALHLRQNNIKDLNEIKHLMNLPVLESLSLSENPCTEDPDYRLTVIKNLRHLLELDGIPVTTEERKEAMKFGRVITPNNNPLRNLGNYIPDGPQIERSPTGSKHKLKGSGSETIHAGESPEITVDEEPPNEISSSKIIKPYPKLQSDCERSEYMLPKFEEKPFTYNEETMAHPMRCKTCKCTGYEPPSLLKMQPPASNLLSATLFLINELDYSSLQIVYSQVAALLNALRLNCHLNPKF